MPFPNLRAKQSKFGKRSKPISKQIWKTKQPRNRANFENKTKLQFQSGYAVYHKPSRSGRDGKPIPYKIMHYIQIIVYRQRSKSHTFNQIPHYFIKQRVQDGKGNPSPTKFCAKKFCIRTLFVTVQSKRTDRGGHHFTAHSKT